MTDRYGVIGHPIAHSKSPTIHRLFAAQTGEDLSYEAFDISPEDLDVRLEELFAAGIRGLNVTVPHKAAVAELMDTLSERAALAGAVNTISVGPETHLDGDNTDGSGLLRDLVHNIDFDPDGKQILILGAGGATRGIVPALLNANPALLCVANRTVERAEEIARRSQELGHISACSFDELGRQSSFDLVINATSAGLHGERPPFPRSIFDNDPICYDLSYAMSETPFIRWAKKQGAEEVYQGWGMLVEQAADAFQIWRGIRPETGSIRENLPK